MLRYILVLFLAASAAALGAQAAPSGFGLSSAIEQHLPGRGGVASLGGGLNADTVDYFDAYATPTANALLALDGSARIPGDVIADDSIPGSRLVPGAVTAGRLGNNSVTTDKISDGQVMNADLAAGAVTSSKIVNGAVTTGKIAAGAVTAGRLSNNSVTSTKITDGEVKASDLAAGAVTQTKIANGAVTGAKLASKFGSSQRELLNFVPRLEAGGPDYDFTNLLPNYPGWTTLDLTTCGVPGSAKAVLLDVTMEDGDSPASLYLSLESMNHNWRTHVAGSDFAGGRQESEQKIVQCKNGQVVYSVSEGEYGDGCIAYLSFTVQGWWEPAKTN